MLTMDNHRKVLLDLFSILTIILLCSVRLSNCKMPAIFCDEFGYWGNAATLAGYDWSELLYENPYYGLGYSLLLLPIIKLCPQPFWYQSAVALNIVFLILSFFMCQKFVRRTVQNLSEESIVFISLITIIYPSNILQAQIAWSETFIYFLMWCTAFLLTKMMDKFCYRTVSLLIIVLGYMYFTHVRTIGIIFAGIVSLFLVFNKEKKSAKSFCLFMLTLILIYLLISWIKTNQIELVYANSEASGINNAALNSKSILGYISRIFVSGKQLLISLYGKLFVLIISTGILLPGAVWMICIRCKEYFFTKDLYWQNSDGKEILIFFAIVSACISLLLCAGQMLSWEARKDFIVYSRYFDNALGPFLSIVFGYALLNPQKIRKIVLGFWFFSGILLLAVWEKVNLAAENFNTSCAPFIGGFYQKALQQGMQGEKRAAYTFTILYFCLSWMVICFILQIGLKKTARIRVWAVSFLVFYSFISYYAGVFPDEIRKSRMEVYTIIHEIEDYMPNCEIYYLKNEELDLFSMEPKWLQYNMPDVPIHVIDDEKLNEICGTNEELILLTNKNDDLNNALIVCKGHLKDKGIFGNLRLCFIR